MGNDIEKRLCVATLISMVLGGLLWSIAIKYNIKGYVYAVNIFISMFMIYLSEKLPVVFNKVYLIKLRKDPTTLLFILFFGPVATIFLFIASLLKPKHFLKNKIVDI